ncbi:14338_t:CDS:1, partial [Ambispora leptoticha]
TKESGAEELFIVADKFSQEAIKEPNLPVSYLYLSKQGSDF